MICFYFFHELRTGRFKGSIFDSTVVLCWRLLDDSTTDDCVGCSLGPVSRSCGEFLITRLVEESPLQMTDKLDKPEVVYSNHDISMDNIGKHRTYRTNHPTNHLRNPSESSRHPIWFTNQSLEVFQRRSESKSFLSSKRRRGRTKWLRWKEGCGFSELPFKE